MFDRRRQEFPSLSAGIHLLSHSLGPMPRGARDAMRDYLERWEGYTRENAWKSAWWALPGEVGDRIAGLLGAPADFRGSDDELIQQFVNGRAEGPMET